MNLKFQLLALMLILNAVPAAFAEDTPAASTPPAEAVVAPKTDTSAADAPAPPPTKKEIAPKAPVTDISRRNKAIDPYNAGVHLYAAKNYDGALLKYQMAAKLDPTYAEPHVNMSMIYYYKKDWKNGLKEVELAMKLDPSLETPILLLNAGLFAGNCAEYDKAMHFFNLALEYNPQDDVVYCDRGNLYLKMKKPDEALADYKMSLKINPKNQQAIQNMQIISGGNWTGGFENIMLERDSVRPKPTTTAVAPKKPSTAPHTSVPKRR